MRFESYPHNVFKNAVTVSTVGVLAVKNFGLAGGNGSALVVSPMVCNCRGAAGFCGVVAAGAGVCCAGALGCAAVWAPANAGTQRAIANPAIIQYEIFK